ncbi:alpha/beta fold hydrolase [Staphylococcus lugdunensis]|uniref:alpha/beta fold hydrolase n=1 Tax=Staphylococcus lugdunensis TaxID=28035 RepID=UPI001F58DB97|nr:alpha/beta hydrolase [Staphylococcus lugdunensis]MCI2765368.1 alpha/beta hydrolase [Staphylococcus lugdunensis]MCI2801864.1 alpha/beta hydrolase [Staphylococcus lugdunensis]
MDKIKSFDQKELVYKDEGQGIPIILLHGLNGNLAGFYNLAAALKTQYRVITYDLRGHGKSSRPDVYHLSDHIGDLKAIMRHLGICTAHLVGHEMGGMVAREFTEQYPSRVLSLTLISSKRKAVVHGFTQLMIEHQEEIQGFNRSEAILILFPYIFKEQSRAMKWFQAQYLYHKATSEDNATASRALYSISNSQAEQPTTIHVPTLVIDGKYDPLISDDDIDNRFTRVQKELFEYSGHAPHIEEPDHFLSFLTQFIDASHS